LNHTPVISTQEKFYQEILFVSINIWLMNLLMRIYGTRRSKINLLLITVVYNKFNYYLNIWKTFTKLPGRFPKNLWSNRPLLVLLLSI